MVLELGRQGLCEYRAGEGDLACSRVHRRETSHIHPHGFRDKWRAWHHLRLALGFNGAEGRETEGLEDLNRHWMMMLRKCIRLSSPLSQ